MLVRIEVVKVVDVEIATDTPEKAIDMITSMSPDQVLSLAKPEQDAYLGTAWAEGVAYYN